MTEIVMKIIYSLRMIEQWRSLEWLSPKYGQGTGTILSLHTKYWLKRYRTLLTNNMEDYSRTITGYGRNVRLVVGVVPPLHSIKCKAVLTTRCERHVV